MIRAFRSTLEDMEDKRSVHSIHSLRSTRSYLLNRPVSDISYIDEESAAKTGQTTLINRNNNQGGTLTVPPARGQSAGGGGGSGNNSGRVKSHGGGMSGGGIAPITNTLNMNNNNVGGGSITVPVPTNTSATNCKATTETAYRVQTKGLDGRRGKNKSKGCSDAQTQSSESSFTVAAAAEQQSAENVFDQQQPQPVSTSGICVQVESLVSQVTSTQTPPQTSILPPSTSPLPMAAAAAAASGLMPPAAAVGAATLLPSPIYPAPGFGYDPSYCQFLGQAADGYQYELVRRPSIGAAVAAAVVPPPPQQPLQTSVSAAAGTTADCLLVPAAPFNQQRRLSGSQSPVPHAQFNPVAGIHPTRSSSPNPHLVSLAASMPGSFDSCAGPPPPTTPIFIQQHQPHPILAPSAAQAVSASRAPQSIVMSSVVSGSPRHFMTTAPPNLYATPTGGGPSGYQPPLVDPASYATNTTDCSWQTAPSSLPTNPTPHATSTGSDLPKPIQETSI